ncbi:MAG TPA: outer membrane protein assembly factor BamC [Rhodocyclaceae bacterium]|nr:outer membrane protein assembly factor BamC [Rhodocyclaceae bacterium]
MKLLRSPATSALMCVLVSSMLGACSSTSGILPASKKIEYKSEGKKIKPLEIPPDLVAPERGGRYAVPDIAKGPTTFSAYSGERQGPVAQGNTEVLPEVGDLRIERSGSQRWLVVPGVPPEKVWDTVKEFWQENGMLINVEMPQAGIMETDWAENRAKLPQDFIRNILGRALDSLYSTAERDKFRTRLEKSADGSTEIYISHRGMYEVYTAERSDQTRWQPREPDPELEAEMLRRLMVRLGTEESKAKAMVAEAAPKVEKAKLNRSGPGGTTLEVREPFDRAWRRVGLALDRVGFTVEDRDRSQGVYYVRYVDPDADAKTKKDDGWLSKMAFWKGGDKDLNKNSQFRIHIKGNGDNTTVQVLTKEGGLDAGEVSGKILGLLHEQLR